MDGHKERIDKIITSMRENLSEQRGVEPDLVEFYLEDMRKSLEERPELIPLMENRGRESKSVRGFIEYVIDYTLFGFASFNLFSAIMYIVHNPINDRWFSRLALSSILYGLWIIQSKLKK